MFKDGDKVKIRNAVSIDVLIYDMFRIVEDEVDNCSAHLNTALELMDDTLTVTASEDRDGYVRVLDSRGFTFYIGAELLELGEENKGNEKPELDMKVIESYVKPLQDYIRSLDEYEKLSVSVSGHDFEVKNVLGTRFRL